jgi:hypothetical protein
MRASRTEAYAALRRNRFGLLTFHDADHNTGSADSLAWIDARLPTALAPAQFAPLTAGNDFAMPALITAATAAAEMIAGRRARDFEIHFLKRFTRTLKALRLPGDGLYFKAIRRATVSEPSPGGQRSQPLRRK